MDNEIYDLHLAAGRAYGRMATCGVKVDYTSEIGAQRAVDKMAGKAKKPLEAYPCAWCNGWHIGRKMSEEELRWAAAHAQASDGMLLFGVSAPDGQDGYVPGAWDEVRRAFMDGHISEEAYEVLRDQMKLLRGFDVRRDA